MLNPWLSRRKTPTPSLRNLDRLELDTAAAELVVEYGELILKDAIRFSKCRSDAEDAYQRSLEILLTKAPTTDPNELVPWIRVVVRREATIIARSNHNRNLRLDETIHPWSVALDGVPDDELDERLELEMGADALRYLTVDQISCLVAQSEGLSYDEIAERTGFTRRKVSRCLQDGRLNFSRRINAIAAGSECERMQPLIRRLFESDASAAVELRPHLRHCLACREQVRSHGRAPRSAAALFPPTLVVLGMNPVTSTTWIGGVVEATKAWFSGQVKRVDRWGELSATKKAGFAVALTAAAVGGGLVVEQKAADLPENEASPKIVGGSGLPVIPLGEIIEVTDAPADDKPKKRKQRRRKGGSGGSGTGTAVSGSGGGGAAPQPQEVEVQPPANSVTQDGGQPVDDGSTEFLPEAR